MMPRTELFYSEMNTPLGRIYLAMTQNGLRCICLSKPEWLRTVDKFSENNRLGFVKDERRFNFLKKNLRRYFSGKLTEFDLNLDFRNATLFQRRVWKEMRKIPYGQTRSYQWLAKRVRVRSPRAIGQACASNPLPLIIPCHRVIASDGTLGGFGSGLAKKIQLLKLEGALS
jgi:O-6-methylguanine DNA methyltransferase